MNLHDTSLPDKVRFFIQFSQAHQKFHCVQCEGIARGVVFESKNGKGESVRRTRNDYNTIIHTANEGEGNRLVHKSDCWVLAETIKVVGTDDEQAPIAAMEIVSKSVTRKCGCVFKGVAIEQPCEKHAALWKTAS